MLPGISGLPDSAVGSPEIVHVGIVGMSRDRHDTPSTVGTHEAPFDGRQKTVIDGRICNRLEFRFRSSTIFAGSTTCQEEAGQETGDWIGEFHITPYRRAVRSRAIGNTAAFSITPAYRDKTVSTSVTQ